MCRGAISMSRPGTVGRTNPHRGLPFAVAALDFFAQAARIFLCDPVRIFRQRLLDIGDRQTAVGKSKDNRLKDLTALSLGNTVSDQIVNSPLLEFEIAMIASSVLFSILRYKVVDQGVNIWQCRAMADFDARYGYIAHG